MKNTNNGPLQTENKSTNSNEIVVLPVSLRDWFAGMAMQGLTSYVNEHKEHYASALKGAAKTSYDIADAMLEARKAASRLEE